jgi:hypothetical protein
MINPKMTKEELFAKYPSLFPKPIHISPGWVDLFDKPLEYINVIIKGNIPYCPQLIIVGTKEKFGTLRIHYQWVMPEGKKWDDYVSSHWYMNELTGVIRYIEFLSSFTCENTGEKGRLFQKNGWYKILSEAEAARLGFEEIKRN